MSLLRACSQRFARLAPGRTHAPEACAGHHWHVIETGWECCHGGHRVRARRGTCPPASDRQDCVSPGEAAEESVALWLTPATGDLRPRRRRKQRTSTA